ncbi:MAG: ABC transporter substrate-binding protein [Pseudomonadota bacterium]
MSLRSLIRTPLTAVALSVSLVTAPVAAFAFGTDDAKVLTEEIATDVLSYIDADISDAAKKERFRQTMNRFADVRTIARFALGVAWRSATEAQQVAYVTAFEEYAANKYGRQFDDFESSGIEVGSALDAGRKGIVVTSRVVRPGQAPVVVEWQFSDRSGSPLLVDIIVEGISLLTTERQEISAKLDARGGDMDRLIADLPALGNAGS